MTKEGANTPAEKNAAVNPEAVNIQLVPADGSDCPLFANVSLVQPSPGAAIIDFGFIDPRAMMALGALAREGKKAPERLGGRLIARIALSYEALAILHRQTANVMQAISKAKPTASGDKKR